MDGERREGLACIAPRTLALSYSRGDLIGVRWEEASIPDMYTIT
jgi:hypothetical protein